MFAVWVCQLLRQLRCDGLKVMITAVFAEIIFTISTGVENGYKHVQLVDP